MKLCIILLLWLTLSLLHPHNKVALPHIKWEAVATESEWFWCLVNQQDYLKKFNQALDIKLFLPLCFQMKMLN